VCTFAFAASSAFTLLPTRASAQHPAAGATHRAVTIAGPAPGISGSILQQALNGPHHEWIVAPGETGLVPRDTSFDATLVIVGGSARVQAKVKGDVIVTGGDLILGVGVRIEGRAIAIGGIVYHSPWAYVRDSTYTYTVHRYDLERRSGAPALVYRRQRESEGRAPFELPGYYGIREITYDRVQGVGISYGPDLVIPFADARINLAAAWHSSLGAFDPSVHLRIPFATAAALDLDARRETHSNELWIESNLDNTFSTLVSGADARNYYRAKRVEGLVSRPIEFLRGRLEVEAGARWEDASSAFTTRYRGNESGARNDHFVAAGKPAPPRPRRPDAATCSLRDPPAASCRGAVAGRRRAVPADGARWVALPADRRRPVLPRAHACRGHHRRPRAGAAISLPRRSAHDLDAGADVTGWRRAPAP